MPKPPRQVFQGLRLGLRHAEDQVIEALLTACNGVTHARERRMLGQARQGIMRAQKFVVHRLPQAAANRSESLSQLLL